MPIGATLHPIADWDDAYANFANVPRSERWPDAWIDAAETFRASARGEIGIAYGARPRETLDLFRPEGEPRGLVVFVHGGYWMRFDPSFFSHLAAGPLARGWAVAMPGYALAPETRLGAIAKQIAAATEYVAGMIEGPIRLVGHSAGGHLVTRIVSSADDVAEDALVARDVLDRIERVVSISGVHDLRPLLRTAMNDTLGLEADEARAESPALLHPVSGIETVAWVGQSERSEFVRQSELLASIWRGLGAATALVVEPDRHHFDVIEGLTEPASPLTEAVVGS